MALRMPTDAPSGDKNAALAPRPTNDPLATPFADANTSLPDAGDGFRSSKYAGLAVLLLVVTIAAGLIVAMRSLGLATRIKLIDTKIDYPLDAPSRAAMQDHMRVINDLKNSGHVVQVPLDQVQMNPFFWKGVTAPTARGKPVLDPADLSRRQREEYLAALRAEVEGLKLNSIMGGGTPVARISGSMVRVGDKVGEHFTVQSISGRSVQLRAEDQVYTLTLGE